MLIILEIILFLIARIYSSYEHRERSRLKVAYSCCTSFNIRAFYTVPIRLEIFSVSEIHPKSIILRPPSEEIVYFLKNSI